MRPSQGLERGRLLQFPLLERPAVGALLAAVAGLLNAWSFGAAGAFATVQSGNLVTAGYAAASGDWPRLATVASALLAFGAGSAASAVLIERRGRRGAVYSTTVLEIEAVLVFALGLLVGLVPVEAGVVSLGFVAGMQGSAFHRDHGMVYGSIAVTFVIQTVFSLTGQALLVQDSRTRRADARTIRIFGAVLLAFAFGGAAGFAVDAVLDGGAIVVAGALLAALAIASRLTKGLVDPETPTGGSQIHKRN